MKSSINAILIGLVSCDSLLILTSFLLFTLNGLGAPVRIANGDHAGNPFNFYYYEIYPYLLPFVYPVALSAQGRETERGSHLTLLGMGPSIYDVLHNTHCFYPALFSTFRLN